MKEAKKDKWVIEKGKAWTACLNIFLFVYTNVGC